MTVCVGNMVSHVVFTRRRDKTAVPQFVCQSGSGKVTLFRFCLTSSAVQHNNLLYSEHTITLVRILYTDRVCQCSTSYLLLLGVANIILDLVSGK